MAGIRSTWPLSIIAEVREMTRSAVTLERSEMISSVRPSLKYSFSASELTLVNGRTTMDLRAGTATGALTSASTNALAVSKRSTGSSAMAQATARATASLAPPSPSSDGASPRKRAAIIAAALAAAKGERPVSIS
jgi:hypothetical protein